MSPVPTDLPNLVERFRNRDRRALAQLISVIDDGADADSLLSRLPAAGQDPPVFGITGSAGVGKSTLVAALIEHFRGEQQSIAVVACDPSSPVSGGSLMGDRIRARIDPSDDGIFFRSFSTRGAAGGISSAVAPALELLARFGFDVLLVETVGVGQDELAVRDVADIVALVLSPGGGDEVQWQKAGLLEVADLVVVNKADLPGADRVAAELSETLALGNRDAPPVLKVTATTGEGVAQLAEQLLELARTTRGTDEH